MPGSLLVVFLYFCDRVSGRSGWSQICSPPKPLSRAEMAGIGHHAWRGRLPCSELCVCLPSLERGTLVFPVSWKIPGHFPKIEEVEKEKVGEGLIHVRVRLLTWVWSL